MTESSSSLTLAQLVPLWQIHLKAQRKNCCAQRKYDATELGFIGSPLRVIVSDSATIHASRVRLEISATSVERSSATSQASRRHSASP